MNKIIKLGNYKGISVTVEKTTVSTEEVEAQINQIMLQSPALAEKDGTIENGDIAIFDFEGFKDGVPFEGGKAEAFQLEIGSGQFIPGFEEQMIGMAKGEEKDLNLSFPADYQAPDLAGADVVFKIKLHEIKNKIEAELTDEYVAGLNFPQINTVEDLRNAITAQAQAQHDQTYRSKVEGEVFNKLIMDCEIEVSEEAIKSASDMQLQHMTMQLAQQGMGLEQYCQMTGITEEDLLKQIEPAAKQQAEFEAIIDEIVSVENLTTTDEEADQQIEMIAQHNNVTKEQVLEQIAVENLKRDLNRMKASQLVMQTANISN